MLSLETSITTEFTLMSMKAGIVPHVPQPLAWQSPSNSPWREARLYLPEGDPPLLIAELVFAGRSCAVPSERLMLNASQCLKTEYGTMTHSI